MTVEQWLAVGAVVLLVLVYSYGVWVGEKDKKEGKKINHDFGM